MPVRATRRLILPSGPGQSDDQAAVYAVSGGLTMLGLHRKRHKATPDQDQDQEQETAQASPASGEDAIPPLAEVEDAPDSPLELGETGWRQVMKRSFKEFKDDRCTVTAGSLAYHWFLALFPALIALLGVTSLAHLGGGTVTRLVNGLDKALPQGAQSVFTDAVQSATSRSSNGAL